MSYDIHMEDADTGDTLEFDKTHDFKGGTYALDGTTEAWLNVTYNYSPFYYQQIDEAKGIRWLYGKRGRDCQEKLKQAIAMLGTKRDTDYWKATPGNAGAALVGLLEFSKKFPDGVFNGD